MNVFSVIDDCVAAAYLRYQHVCCDDDPPNIAVQLINKISSQYYARHSHRTAAASSLRKMPFCLEFCVNFEDPPQWLYNRDYSKLFYGTIAHC